MRRNELQMSAMVLVGLAAFGLTPTNASRADGGPEPRIQADVVLRGGDLVDGTGSPARRADVALRGDRVVAVGSFAADPSAKVIDVSGRVIAPGFIDLHTHSDGPIVRAETRANVNYLRQGVTTIVTGNCGSGPIDVAAFLAKVDRDGAGSNVIHLVPHGGVRASVLGDRDVLAGPEALEAMRRKVDQGMKDGAWGMSTGLIYLPGRFADTAELIELSKVVARHGGLYASHMRDEGRGLLTSIDEILTIGREAGLPVHVSHLKAGGKAAWGLVVPACDRISQARAAGQAITADQYPYVASSTSLSAMVMPTWARLLKADELAQVAADPEKEKKLRADIEAALKARDGGASVRIARYRPKAERVGKDLVAIAKQEGTTPVDVVIDIEEHGGASAISFGMSEQDVRHVMAQPFVATASDGSAQALNSGDMPHPRSYGTFPRKIRYALDDQVVTLEQALRSSSGLPAEVLRLPDRGLIKPGFIADLVIFDPATFRDAATFDDPKKLAPGADYVFVNGVAVIAAGELTGKLPGRALRLQTDGPPDLIVRLGRVWTGDPANPWAEAIASRKGTIVAVGATADVMKLKGPLTRVVERPTAFATPGLHDAHGHLQSLGEATESIDLRGVDTLDRVAAMVKERLAQTPADRWVVGRNWDQSLWPGGAFPTAKTLDQVAPDRPVWLTRVDGHAGWANTEAMRRAKINKETTPPSDGQIIRDTNGQPSGVFVDGAMGLIERIVPASTLEDAKRHLLVAQRICLENGLTCVHDAGVGRRTEQAYRDLEEQGVLKLRVYAMASPPDGREVDFVSRPPASSKPGDRFEMRAIKLFIDGAMGSRGALVFEPYADDPTNRGLTLVPPERLLAVTTKALETGWQVCTHAIGDKGNALVLDAYEAARRAVPTATDPRLRIEHAQVVRKGDVARFRESATIASMQPSHASTDKRWADERLGKDSERVQGAYAWRWFLNEKVRMAFGSDFPVEVANPFWGIYAGITRQDEKGGPKDGWHPDQRMTPDETLKGFTAGAAFAMFAEERLGILRPGMNMDMTIIDRDLFKASPREVLEAKVLMTIIEGEAVYEAR